MNPEIATFFENIFPMKNRVSNPTNNIPSSASSVADLTHEPESEPEPRRSKRIRTEKNFGEGFFTYLIEDTPSTYLEALSSPDAPFWKEAINSEFESIIENNTWILTNLPPGNKPLGCKWIFKKKMRTDGTIEKYKARLVVQGFGQKGGIDFFDTYSPVAHISTIRVILALASIYKLYVHQMDVKTAFLHGDLDEEIYMHQPEGFSVPGQENKVCRLVKSLYGLKQAPKQWHEKFDQVILSYGFHINESDNCLYQKQVNDQFIFLCLYVDDILILAPDLNLVNDIKNFLSHHFNMKDLGNADLILGMKIIRTVESISLSQSHYTKKLIDKFGYSNYSTFSSPFDPSTHLTKNTGIPINQ